MTMSIRLTLNCLSLLTKLEELEVTHLNLLNLDLEQACEKKKKVLSPNSRQLVDARNSLQEQVVTASSNFGVTTPTNLNMTSTIQ